MRVQSRLGADLDKLQLPVVLSISVLLPREAKIQADGFIDDSDDAEFLRCVEG